MTTAAARARAWLLCLLVAALVVPGAAFADATPVQLVLLYMPQVSNTGTTSASGIAELVMPEGEVRITAANLPHLEGDHRYAAWVVNTETNQFQQLGSFNTSEATGSVRYENVLADAIPNKQWNLLLVTVEDNARATRPGGKRSIAGVFPRAEGDPVPGLLPNTGGAGTYYPIASSRPDWLAIAGLATLTAALGAVAGYAFGRTRR